jgi:hypothetical protein
MYDLGKKGRGPVPFDLETDLKKDPAKAKKTMKDVEATIFELKNLLRQGADTGDFDDYGVLLHGFTALQKVLNRALKK